MFEIDVCYKFIFESMLEDDVLGYIANKVYEYTHAGIFFVSESGEILAYACSGKDQSMRSIIEEHVTLEDYLYFFEEVSPNGEFQTVAAVKDKKKNIGYIIIHYSNEEFRTFFEELGTILTETARQYFEEKQKNTYLNLSLKDYIIGWMIFEGQHFVESEQSHTLKGNYLMALFTDDFSDMAAEKLADSEQGHNGRKWLKNAGYWAFVGLLVAFFTYKGYNLIQMVRELAYEPYYLWQQDYVDGSAEMYEVDGVTIYVPTDRGQIGYNKFPSSPIVQDIELRGNSIRNGFRKKPK